MYAVYSVLLVFTSPETLEGMYIFSDNPPVQRREVIEYPQYLGVILSVLSTASQMRSPIASGQTEPLLMWCRKIRSMYSS